jgi:DNA-binding protein HU-beta
MRKSDFVDELAKRTGTTKAAAAAGLDAALEIISDTLKAGDSVVLTGFGTFEAADRPEREARNPRTGDTMTVAAKRVPRFKPGKSLKDGML